MKKKIILMLAIAAILVCAFAISASATVPEWTDVDMTYDEQMRLTSQFGIVSDTSSRIMFADQKTYPAWYFIKTEKVNDFLWLGDDTDFNKIGLDFNCFNDVSKLSYTKADVVKLEVPVGIQGIGQKALAYGNGLTSLQYVKLPEGLTVIEKYAFKSNAERTGALIQVDMPSTLTTIKEQAFYYCNTLTSIHIPDKVTTIESEAFYRCYSLATITGGKNVTSVKNSAFSRCPITDAGNIFDNVENIEIYAFYYIAVTDISLPNVKTIGYQAFNAPSNLVTLKIGPNATVDDQAFLNATKLTTLTVGENTTFKKETFHNAKNISTIYYTGSDAADLSGYNNIDVSKVVVNVNYCDAFYDGNHLEDGNPCIINCSQCNTYGVADKAPVHSEIYTISYESFGALGEKIFTCTNEGCEHERTESTPALFVCLGYSTQEYSNGGIQISFVVNYEAINEYNTLNGTNIRYGAFAVSQANAEGNEIVNANGEGSTGVACTEFSTRNYDIFAIKVIGFNLGEVYKEAQIALGAYVIDDGKVSYLQVGTPAEGQSYCYTSYNQQVNG